MASNDFGFEEEKEDNFGFELEQTEQKLPEVSQLEALGSGLAEGGTLGFSDELSAALGAGSEALAGLTGEPGFEPHPGESPLDQLKRTYEQYRNEERQAQKAAIEQFPGTTIAGNLMGGLALPVGTLGGAAKGAPLLSKMGKGALTGGAMGATMGLGMSESETVPEMTEDVLSGGELGMFVGGLAPAISTVASKTASGIRGSKPVQDLLESYSRGKAGQVLTGDTGREQAAQAVGKFSQETQEALKDRLNLFGKAKEKILKRSPDSVNIDKSVDSYKKMIDMAESQTSNPASRSEYDKLRKVLDLRTKGKKTTEQILEEAPDIHPEIKKLIDKRDTIATKSLQNEKYRQGYNQMLKKRALAEDRGIRFDDDIQFYTNDDGKGIFNLTGRDANNKVIRVNQVIDESPIPVSYKSGPKALAEDIGEAVPGTTGNVSNVETFTGVDGNDYATFVDRSSGKLYTKKLSELTPKEKSVSTFIGGKSDLSAQELDNLRKDLQQFTGRGDQAFQDPRAQKIALNMVNDLGETIQEISPGYQRANQGYSNVKNIIKDMGLDGIQSVDDVMRAITGDINKVLSENPSGYTEKFILDRFKEKLRQSDPDLAIKIIPELEEVVRRTELAQQRATPGLVVGKTVTARTGAEGIPTVMGNIAGRAVGEVKKDISKATPETIKRFAKMSSEKLQQISQKYSTSDRPALQNLSNILNNMASKDERLRNSILFGLLQNPVYRQVLSEESGE